VKIGILTFQYAYNYGALLQAYGLYRYLEGLGHDVRFINLIPKFVTSSSLIALLKKWVRELLKQEYDMPRHILKRHQFDRFRQHFLPLTPPCSTRNELENVSSGLDAVISGSDQVWNGDFIEGIASHYFLDFTDIKSCRRISYAASFGNARERQPIETIKAAQKFLQHFKSISVRDELSAEIVNELSGRQAEVVLDPTLLHDFQDISGCRGNNGQDYIGSYYISENHAKLGHAILVHLNNRLELPVIMIGNRMKKFRYYNANISASPLGWLRFMRNASFICADSFHATVFSVKFRKPFITWCGNRPQRAQSFLRLCGLENRQVSSANPDAISELINTPIDYNAVFEKLQPHISRAQSFIQQALAD
jgi:hypothetical protein